MKALLLFVALALPAQAELLNGHVTRVFDGDTLTAQLSDGRIVKIRLQWIDAPELRQPYGPVARQALSDLVLNKDVLIDSAGPDRYGRLLGAIYLNVNAALVDQGAAWVYRTYPHPKPLETLEATAQTARRGLWAEQQYCPPWDFRRTRCPE